MAASDEDGSQTDNKNEDSATRDATKQISTISTIQKEIENKLNRVGVSYEAKVSAVLSGWDRLAGVDGDISDLQPLATFLYRWSLRLILQGEWQSVGKIVKTRLGVTLQRCSRVVLLHPLCRTLIPLVSEPWAQTKTIFSSTQLNDDEAIKYICSESWEVVRVRVDTMIESKCEKLAFKVLKVCIRCIKLRSDGMEVPLYTDEDHNHFVDLYFVLLYKFDRNAFLTEVKELDVINGVDLVRRLIDKQDKSKIWKHRLKIADLVIQIFLAKTIVKEYCQDFWCVFVEWCSVQIAAEVASDLLSQMIHKYMQLSQSSQHIYNMSSILHKKFGGHLAPLVTELLIRALTMDMNTLEALKLRQSSPSKDEQTKLERQMADGFMDLSAVFEHHQCVARECVLTAFSLHPTPERLHMLHSYGKKGVELLQQAECSMETENAENAENTQNAENVENTEHAQVPHGSHGLPHSFPHAVEGPGEAQGETQVPHGLPHGLPQGDGSEAAYGVPHGETQVPQVSHGAPQAFPQGDGSMEVAHGGPQVPHGPPHAFPPAEDPNLYSVEGPLASGVPQLTMGAPEAMDVPQAVSQANEVPQQVPSEISQAIAGPQFSQGGPQVVNEVPQTVNEVPQTVNEVPQTVNEVPQQGSPFLRHGTPTEVPQEIGGYQRLSPGIERGQINTQSDTGAQRYTPETPHMFPATSENGQQFIPATSETQQFFPAISESQQQFQATSETGQQFSATSENGQQFFPATSETGQQFSATSETGQQFSATPENGQQFFPATSETQQQFPATSETGQQFSATLQSHESVLQCPDYGNAVHPGSPLMELGQVCSQIMESEQVRSHINSPIPEFGQYASPGSPITDFQHGGSPKVDELANQASAASQSILRQCLSRSLKNPPCSPRSPHTHPSAAGFPSSPHTPGSALSPSPHYSFVSTSHQLHHPVTPPFQSQSSHHLSAQPTQHPTLPPTQHPLHLSGTSSPVHIFDPPHSSQSQSPSHMSALPPEHSGTMSPAPHLAAHLAEPQGTIFPAPQLAGHLSEPQGIATPTHLAAHLAEHGVPTAPNLSTHPAEHSGTQSPAPHLAVLPPEHQGIATPPHLTALTTEHLSSLSISPANSSMSEFHGFNSPNLASKLKMLSGKLENCEGAERREGSEGGCGAKEGGMERREEVYEGAKEGGREEMESKYDGERETSEIFEQRNVTNFESSNYTQENEQNTEQTENVETYVQKNEIYSQNETYGQKNEMYGGNIQSNNVENVEMYEGERNTETYGERNVEMSRREDETSGNICEENVTEMYGENCVYEVGRAQEYSAEINMDTGQQETQKEIPENNQEIQGNPQPEIYENSQYSQQENQGYSQHLHSEMSVSDGNGTNINANGVEISGNASEASQNYTQTSGNASEGSQNCAEASGNYAEMSRNGSEASQNCAEASGNYAEVSGNASEASQNCAEANPTQTKDLKDLSVSEEVNEGLNAQARHRDDYDSMDKFYKSTENFIHQLSQEPRRVPVSRFTNVMRKIQDLSYDILTQPNQVLDSEQLGLSKELCDDLAVVLSSPRWQVLSWKRDWRELSNICEHYLRDTDSTKNTTKELKYLNIDYSQFQNMPSAEVTEFTGIEKGYEHFVKHDSDSDLSDNETESKKCKMKHRNSDSDSDYGGVKDSPCYMIPISESDDSDVEKGKTIIKKAKGIIEGKRVTAFSNQDRRKRIRIDAETGKLKNDRNLLNTLRLFRHHKYGGEQVAEVKLEVKREGPKSPPLSSINLTPRVVLTERQRAPSDQVQRGATTVMAGRYRQKQPGQNLRQNTPRRPMQSSQAPTWRYVGSLMETAGPKTGPQVILPRSTSVQCYIRSKDGKVRAAPFHRTLLTNGRPSNAPNATNAPSNTTSNTPNLPSNISIGLTSIIPKSENNPTQPSNTPSNTPNQTSNNLNQPSNTPNLTNTSNNHPSNMKGLGNIGNSLGNNLANPSYLKSSNRPTSGFDDSYAKFLLQQSHGKNSSQTNHPSITITRKKMTIDDSLDYLKKQGTTVTYKNLQSVYKSANFQSASARALATAQKNVLSRIMSPENAISAFNTRTEIAMPVSNNNPNVNPTDKSTPNLRVLPKGTTVVRRQKSDGAGPSGVNSGVNNSGTRLTRPGSSGANIRPGANVRPGTVRMAMRGGGLRTPYRNIVVSGLTGGPSAATQGPGTSESSPGSPQVKQEAEGEPSDAVEDSDTAENIGGNTGDGTTVFRPITRDDQRNLGVSEVSLGGNETPRQNLGVNEAPRSIGVNIEGQIQNLGVNEGQIQNLGINLGVSEAPRQNLGVSETPRSNLGAIEQVFGEVAGVSVTSAVPAPLVNATVVGCVQNNNNNNIPPTRTLNDGNKNDDDDDNEMLIILSNTGNQKNQGNSGNQSQNQGKNPSENQKKSVSQSAQNSNEGETGERNERTGERSSVDRHVLTYSTITTTVATPQGDTRAASMLETLLRDRTIPPTLPQSLISQPCTAITTITNALPSTITSTISIGTGASGSASLPSTVTIGTGRANTGSLASTGSLPSTITIGTAGTASNIGTAGSSTLSLPSTVTIGTGRSNTGSLASTGSLPSTITIGTGASSTANLPSTVTIGTGRANTSTLPSTITIGTAGTASNIGTLPSTITIGGTGASNIATLPSTVTIGTGRANTGSLPSTVTIGTAGTASNTGTLPSTITIGGTGSLPSTITSLTGGSLSTLPSTITRIGTGSLPSTITSIGTGSLPSTITIGTGSLPSTVNITLPSTTNASTSILTPSTATTSTSILTPSTATTSIVLPTSTIIGSTLPSTVIGSTGNPSTIISTTLPNTVIGSTGNASTIIGSTLPSTVIGSTGNPSTIIGSTGNPSTIIGSTGNPSTIIGSTGNPSTIIGSTGNLPSTIIGTSIASIIGNNIGSLAVTSENNLSGGNVVFSGGGAASGVIMTPGQTGGVVVASGGIVENSTGPVGTSVATPVATPVQQVLLPGQLVQVHTSDGSTGLGIVHSSSLDLRIPAGTRVIKSSPVAAVGGVRTTLAQPQSQNPRQVNVLHNVKILQNRQIVRTVVVPHTVALQGLGSQSQLKPQVVALSQGTSTASDGTLIPQSSSTVRAKIPSSIVQKISRNSLVIRTLRPQAAQGDSAIEEGLGAKLNLQQLLEDKGAGTSNVTVARLPQDEGLGERLSHYLKNALVSTTSTQSVGTQTLTTAVKPSAGQSVNQVALNNLRGATILSGNIQVPGASISGTNQQSQQLSLPLTPTSAVSSETLEQIREFESVFEKVSNKSGATTGGKEESEASTETFSATTSGISSEESMIAAQLLSMANDTPTTTTSSYVYSVPTTVYDVGGTRLTEGTFITTQAGTYILVNHSGSSGLVNVSSAVSQSVTQSVSQPPAAASPTLSSASSHSSIASSPSSTSSRKKTPPKPKVVPPAPPVAAKPKTPPPPKAPAPKPTVAKPQVEESDEMKARIQAILEKYKQELAITPQQQPAPRNRKNCPPPKNEGKSSNKKKSPVKKIEGPGNSPAVSEGSAVGCPSPSPSPGPASDNSAGLSSTSTQFASQGSSTEEKVKVENAEVATGTPQILQGVVVSNVKVEGSNLSNLSSASSLPQGLGGRVVQLFRHGGKVTAITTRQPLSKVKSGQSAPPPNVTIQGRINMNDLMESHIASLLTSTTTQPLSKIIQQQPISQPIQQVVVQASAVQQPVLQQIPSAGKEKEQQKCGVIQQICVNNDEILRPNLSLQSNISLQSPQIKTIVSEEVAKSPSTSIIVSTSSPSTQNISIGTGTSIGTSTGPSLSATSSPQTPQNPIPSPQTPKPVTPSQPSPAETPSFQIGDESSESEHSMNESGAPLPPFFTLKSFIMQSPQQAKEGGTEKALTGAGQNSTASDTAAIPSRGQQRTSQHTISQPPRKPVIRTGPNPGTRRLILGTDSRTLMLTRGSMERPGGPESVLGSMSSPSSVESSPGTSSRIKLATRPQDTRSSSIDSLKSDLSVEEVQIPPSPATLTKQLQNAYMTDAALSPSVSQSQSGSSYSSPSTTHDIAFPETTPSSEELLSHTVSYTTPGLSVTDVGHDPDVGDAQGALSSPSGDVYLHHSGTFEPLESGGLGGVSIGLEVRTHSPGLEVRHSPVLSDLVSSGPLLPWSPRSADSMMVQSPSLNDALTANIPLDVNHSEDSLCDSSTAFPGLFSIEGDRVSVSSSTSRSNTPGVVGAGMGFAQETQEVTIDLRESEQDHTITSTRSPTELELPVTTLSTVRLSSLHSHGGSIGVQETPWRFETLGHNSKSLGASRAPEGSLGASRGSEISLGVNRGSEISLGGTSRVSELSLAVSRGSEISLGGTSRVSELSLAVSRGSEISLGGTSRVSELSLAVSRGSEISLGALNRGSEISLGALNRGSEISLGGVNRGSEISLAVSRASEMSLGVSRGSEISLGGTSRVSELSLAVSRASEMSLGVSRASEMSLGVSRGSEISLGASLGPETSLETSLRTSPCPETPLGAIRGPETPLGASRGPETSATSATNGHNTKKTKPDAKPGPSKVKVKTEGDKSEKPPGKKIGDKESDLAEISETKTKENTRQIKQENKQENKQEYKPGTKGRKRSQRITTDRRKIGAKKDLKEPTKNGHDEKTEIKAEIKSEVKSEAATRATTPAPSGRKKRRGAPKNAGRSRAKEEEEEGRKTRGRKRVSAGTCGAESEEDSEVEMKRGRARSRRSEDDDYNHLEEEKARGRHVSGTSDTSSNYSMECSVVNRRRRRHSRESSVSSRDGSPTVAHHEAPAGGGVSTRRSSNRDHAKKKKCSCCIGGEQKKVEKGNSRRRSSRASTSSSLH